MDGIPDGFAYLPRRSGMPMGPFLSQHWGDLASVLGLSLALFGIYRTYRAARQAEGSAQEARKAAVEARDRILKFDLVSDLTRCITIMEEIKRLHRANAWHSLPDRYQSLRQLLVAIRGNSGASLSASQVAALIGAAQQFSNFESSVDEANARQAAPDNVVRMNSIVSKQIEKLTEIVVTLRNRIEG